MMQGSSSGSATIDPGYMGLENLALGDEQTELSGETSSTAVIGEWDNDRGEEYAVEIRAPAEVGESSVPYQQVLPQYRKDAEQAIERSEIPREHEDRVKQYFDSLGRGDE